MDTHAAIDSTSGYCSETKTFYSLRPTVSLPTSDQPLSVAQFAFSLLRLPETAASETFLIDASTGRKLSYSDFLRQTRSLASSIQSRFPSLARNSVALVVSPTSVHVPVVFFALLSLGVVVSPANPLSTSSELAHIVGLSKPSLAFTTSAASNKLPQLPLGTVLIDSPEFTDMIEARSSSSDESSNRRVRQSDTAAILYSSGTTGRVKGVETAVIMDRFDFENMLVAIHNYRVTYLPASPPLVVALAKSDLVTKYDLSSLEMVACGGAPLGREAAESFMARYPRVVVLQGFGMTETSGSVTGMISPEESLKYASAGRLFPTVEAKIVDPESGAALPPGQHGELLLRGPLIMKGYVGDSSATLATLDSQGWLRTGDLCYFDSDGFLYIVGRLKELIKYKAYQVPPAELEHLLQSIPDVSDAAVIPYPDEEAGEIPMAYIVRVPGSKITETQIMDIIAKQVAPYKKIRRVSFISSIPKSQAGKILRRELIAHAVSAASSKL